MASEEITRPNSQMFKHHDEESGVTKPVQISPPQKPSWYKARWLGNHFVLVYLKGKPFLTAGPHWPLFSITFAFFATVGFLILYYVVADKPDIVKYISWGLVLTFLFSYFMAGMLNPGIVTGQSTPYQAVESSEEGPKTQRGPKTFCQRCNIPKDAKTYHCDECDLCIADYDHHCPWTSKCIGGGNICFFYAFVVLTPFFLVFAFVITATTQVQAGRQNSK